MNEKSRDSILSWTLISLAAVILLAVFYGIWCDVIDGRLYNPVLEFGKRSSGITHQTIKDTYHPGEMVYARVILQKQRNITGIIQWQLINKVTQKFPERPGSLPMGIYDHVVSVEQIPLDAQPGEHWFCGTVKYKVNWLSSPVTYDLWTNKFLVVKP